MILLDYKDRRPIYEQVVEKLKDLMICGVLEQDAQLPSVRVLATDLSINPNTIQRAYAELERRGFIYSVKGRGSFVADSSSIRALKNSELKKELLNWIQEAKRAGLTEDKAHAWIAEEWVRQEYLTGEEREDDKSRESDKKKFDDIVAVDHVSAQIRDGNVFGLIGTNGAGKSTFLRMMSGILKPDEGSVTIDGEQIFENEKVKGRFFYISDDQYYFNNASPLDMMEFYSRIYPQFNKERFHNLLGSFGLEARRKVHTFSKGMKKNSFPSFAGYVPIRIIFSVMKPLTDLIR